MPYCAPPLEYDNMDLEMLQEVVPMLKQQLEKSMLDRNYVQLERVRRQIAGTHDVFAATPVRRRPPYDSIEMLAFRKVESFGSSPR